MTALPNSPAAARNSDAILAVIRHEFSSARAVLEIGSGTGQHAVRFAAELPGLTWQPSDLAQHHEGIQAWIAARGGDNIREPLLLDVRKSGPIAGPYDAIFSANTAHIMSFDAVTAMFELAGRVLEPGGVFCLYGPFNLRGAFTSSSNEAFDSALRARDPAMGIRDLAELERLAGDNRMVLRRRYAMPANNMVLVFAKNGVTR